MTPRACSATRSGTRSVANRPWSPTRSAAARRFRVDISPFCGLPDAPAADDWDALRTLVGPGEIALLLRDEIVPPDAWESTFALSGVQMVFDADAPSSAPRADPTRFPIVTLGLDDVPDMLDLVARTEPGPVHTEDDRTRYLPRRPRRRRAHRDGR